MGALKVWPGGVATGVVAATIAKKFAVKVSVPFALVPLTVTV
jgi:hypothetical protein